jgi:hypothetical protein
MQIIGVMFSAPGACEYGRLAKVWEYSARKAHPDATVKLIKKKDAAGKTSHQRRNQYKLEEWNRQIQAATEDTILMDVDMVIIKEIAHVFEREFDICYTQRTKTRMPLNGGVLFVKPTRAAKTFFEEWVKVDAELLLKRGRYTPYIRKYGGQNQASFGYMLENKKANKRIVNTCIDKVPCTVYNVCQEEWHAVDDGTRVIHCKSGLKRILSQSGEKRPMHEKYRKAVDLWKAMAKEANTATG